MNTITFAKKYAEQGWQSFPIKERDKTPIVKWADVATTEENMLVGWWDTMPEANIAIACGKRSGIVVLDVDAGHGGYESLTVLFEKYGPLPTTPVSKTGSGGEHIFFKHPGIEIRNSAGKLGKGLDIRGDGGYVVAPPSIHPNGNAYEWEVRPSETPLADMPEWMIELLREKNPQPQAKTESEEIIMGERNNYLTQLAGSMRRKGFTEDGIFAALQVQNRQKCSPPLADGELWQISRSVSRYEPQDEPQVETLVPVSIHVMDELEADIKAREKDPRDVWGIHYAWDYISLITGGKQLGELIIVGGEPGVGKSWWAHQDALFTAIGNPSKKIPETPVLIWSGEMKRKQVYRRFLEMLGVNKRKMLTGEMTQEDWQLFNDAKAIIQASPIYVEDKPLDLKNVRNFLSRQVDAFGIKQAVFDYDWLINAPGGNEIEKSQNISREFKQITQELNLSVILISSVNKGGMDTTNENVTKSALSGSGKKIHDADVIYMLTKYNEKRTPIEMEFVQPKDYWKVLTLHVAKGRELDYNLPNGAINYLRMTPNPMFKELRDASKKPDWMK